MSEITTPRPVAFNYAFILINLFGLGYLFYYPRPLFATDGGFNRLALLDENLTFNYILVIELNFVYLHIDTYEIGFNFEGTLIYLDISIDAFEKTEYINDIAL